MSKEITTAVEEIIDLDELMNDYRGLLNAAYKRMQPKIPTETNKKTRKLIRKAIEVGVGIAEIDMYNDVQEFSMEKDYDMLVNNGIKEIIGEMKVTDAERSLIRQAIESGIREGIKDNMVRGERYY